MWGTLQLASDQSSDCNEEGGIPACRILLVRFPVTIPVWQPDMGMLRESGDVLRQFLQESQCFWNRHSGRA
jgi:hypothetical protein